jgi:hypothetical protein
MLIICRSALRQLWAEIAKAGFVEPDLDNASEGNNQINVIYYVNRN